MKLYEMFLFEGKEDFLEKQYGAQLSQVLSRNDIQKTPLEVIQQLKDADPTGGKYLEWIVKQFCKETFILEDIPMIRMDLESFNSFKNRLQKKDINLYDTIFDLREKLDLLRNDVSELYSDQEQGKLIQSLVNNGDLKIIFNNGRIRIFRLDSFTGSEVLSRGTKWCTQDERLYDSYSERGHLYVIYIGTNKFQFHFESSQFMKTNDQQIQNGDINEKDTQLLKKVFSEIDQSYIERMPFVFLTIDELLLRYHNIKNNKHISRDLITTIINTKDSKITTFLKEEESFLIELLAHEIRLRDIYLTKFNFQFLRTLLLHGVNIGVLKFTDVDAIADFITDFDIEQWPLFNMFYSIIRDPRLLKQCNSPKGEKCNRILINHVNKLGVQTQFLKRVLFDNEKDLTNIPLLWITGLDNLEKHLEFFKMSKSIKTRKTANKILSIISNSQPISLSTNDKKAQAANNPEYIKYAKREDMTHDYIMKAIKLNPLNLKYVPDDMVTEDMLFAFIRYSDGLHKLKNLPDSKVSKDFTDFLISQGYNIIKRLYPQRYPRV